MPGLQSPPIVGVDLLARSFNPPNVTFGGKTSIFALAGSGGGSGVSNVNGISGAVNIKSTDGSVLITEVGQDIELAVQFPPPVITTTVNALSGAVLLASPDSSVIITQSGQTIELQVATPPTFNFEGIQNKLGIIPVLPFTTDVIELASANTGTPPTAIVPDATAPTSSTTPAGTACWLYTKPVANTGFNWYMYNPRFGNPSAILPYVKYNPNPVEKIQSVWALVQPAVNTNIYTAGIISLNLYSFDDINPPTSSFYNTRWAYSNSQGANSGQTGTNLYAGFTYLLYAFDSARITNQTGVGQPDSQDSGLRDPYDVYTDVHHIPLQNCVIAFNPDATTNFITWNSTTAFLTGQTCIFSGFGTNANGIFYTAVQNSTNQLPVSATGVPNLANWTAIVPQPSSYASQPILSMNLTGINGVAPGWTAGPLLRVLSMGWSAGNTTFVQTASERYVLN